jgi:Chlorophyll A-B binding protein
MGWAEGKRWMDIKNPGSQGEPGSFLGLEGNFKGTGAVGYPGNIFNPMGMGKDNMREMQTKVSFTQATPSSAR